MLRPRIGFQIDETQRMVTVRYIGAIDGDQVVREVLGAYQGLDRAWEYDCIWDLSRHAGVVGIRHNDALAQGWKNITGGRDAGRLTAVVSTDPLIDARLPLTQVMFPFRTVALFGNVEAARAWIEATRAEVTTDISAA
jgi:hypothetical protein